MRPRVGLRRSSNSPDNEAMKVNDRAGRQRSWMGDRLAGSIDARSCFGKIAGLIAGAVRLLTGGLACFEMPHLCAGLF
jgi:hypothetical protein